VSRRSALAWTYDNHSETVLRWALLTHDPERLQQAQQLLKTALAYRSQVASEAQLKLLAQLGVINVRKNIIRANAVEKEWAGQYKEAAELLVTAVDLSLQLYQSNIKQYARQMQLDSLVTLFENAAAMYAKAKMQPDCQIQLQRGKTFLSEKPALKI